MKTKLHLILIIIVLSLNAQAQDSLVERFQMTESQMLEDLRAGIKKPVSLHEACKSVYKYTQAEASESLPGQQKIDFILVSKKYRQMYLFSKNKLIYKYKTTFGKGYENGPKIQEGDGRTPEGVYQIDAKNYNSKFHRSLHVSYPNAYDIEFAKKYGVSAGGDIMIHGVSNKFGNASDWLSDVINKKNWTAGCMAVRNSQVRHLMDKVPVKTTVAICPL